MHMYVQYMLRTGLLLSLLYLVERPSTHLEILFGVLLLNSLRNVQYIIPTVLFHFVLCYLQTEGYHFLKVNTI